MHDEVKGLDSLCPESELKGFGKRRTYEKQIQCQKNRLGKTQTNTTSDFKSESRWCERVYRQQNTPFVTVWASISARGCHPAYKCWLECLSTPAWSKLKTEGNTSHNLTTHLHTHEVQLEEKECISVLQRNRINRRSLKNKELAYAIMETKSQDLQSTNWRPKRAYGASSSPKTSRLGAQQQMFQVWRQEKTDVPTQGG